MKWSAEQYVAFEDERTRPVRDLVNAVPAIDAHAVVDLGCGPGNSTEVLAARFPGAVVKGVDSSAEMIEAARRRLPGLSFERAAIETWAGAGAVRRDSGECRAAMGAGPQYAFAQFGEAARAWGKPCHSDAR